MKRMIDQASFDKASSDIKEIQDLLSGKAFFDGNITVETIGGDKGVKKANLPTTAGTYKLSSGGILAVKVNSASSITVTALYSDSMYTETRNPASNSNFLFNEDTRLGEKPIYCHPIKIYNAQDSTKKFMLTMLIFNNEKTAFTLSTLKTYLSNVAASVGSLTTFLVSGYYNDGGTNIIQSASYLYVKSDGTNAGIDGANVGGTNYVSTGDLTWENLFPSGSPFSDGVNRIN